MYIPRKLPFVIVEKLCFFNEASSSKRVVLHWDPLESTICSAVSMFRVSINLWKFGRNCCRIRLLWIWYTICRGSNSLNWYGKKTCLISNYHVKKRLPLIQTFTGTGGHTWYLIVVLSSRPDLIVIETFATI